MSGVVAHQNGTLQENVVKNSVTGHAATKKEWIKAGLARHNTSLP
jgi:hypothetical protein